MYVVFGRIETFEYLGFTPHGKWHFSEKAQLLEKYQDTEQKVFTDAFTVTGNKFGDYDSKVWNICYLIDTLQDRVSEDDFVNIGPVCLEGIRYIFGAKTDKKQAEKYLKELRAHQRDFFRMFSL